MPRANSLFFSRRPRRNAEENQLLCLGEGLRVLRALCRINPLTKKLRACSDAITKRYFLDFLAEAAEERGGVALAYFPASQGIGLESHAPVIM